MQYPPSGGVGGGIPGLVGPPGLGAGTAADALAAANARQRIPLPSQQDGFKAEQARGNFRHAR